MDTAPTKRREAIARVSDSLAQLAAVLANETDSGFAILGDFICVFETVSLNPADEERTSYEICVSNDNLAEHRARGLLDIGLDVIMEDM